MFALNIAVAWKATSFPTPSCFLYWLIELLFSLTQKKRENAANSQSGAKRDTPNMADVLKGLGSVKLRAVARSVTSALESERCQFLPDSWCIYHSPEGHSKTLVISDHMCHWPKDYRVLDQGSHPLNQDSVLQQQSRKCGTTHIACVPVQFKAWREENRLWK